jgi:spoIIIJ-associated protein
MKKIEAPTLEEAYEKAAEYFGCSVVELQCEIVQYPSVGLLGLFKKPAVIVAAVREDAAIKKASSSSENAFYDEEKISETAAEEVMRTIIQEEKQNELREEKCDAHTLQTPYEEDAVVESFFEKERTKENEEDAEALTLPSELGDEADIARSIEESLRHLMDVSCFDIDTVEVDVDGNTAYIFIDGEDAALLIGKEGYRYNALSYMLFNWIHDKYDLYIKLEIAQFYTSQQEMMRHMLQPLIEEIQREGRGRTRFLDGILVQIALEQLRQAFPDKYVAIKRARNGQRFVVVNDFYTSKSYE